MKFPVWLETICVLPKSFQIPQQKIVQPKNYIIAWPIKLEDHRFVPSFQKSFVLGKDRPRQALQGRSSQTGGCPSFSQSFSSEGCVVADTSFPIGGSSWNPETQLLAPTAVQVSITTPSGEVKTQECLAGADIVVQVPSWLIEQGLSMVVGLWAIQKFLLKVKGGWKFQIDFLDFQFCILDWKCCGFLENNFSGEWQPHKRQSSLRIELSSSLPAGRHSATPKVGATLFFSQAPPKHRFHDIHYLWVWFSNLFEHDQSWWFIMVGFNFSLHI